MTISIGNDHAGVNLKNYIVKHLEGKGFKINDKGTNTDKSVDYPDFIHPVLGLKTSELLDELEIRDDIVDINFSLED